MRPPRLQRPNRVKRKPEPLTQDIGMLKPRIARSALLAPLKPRRLCMLIAGLACLFAFVSPLALCQKAPSDKEKVPVVPPKVVYTEGSLHGFLTLRSMQGEALADGELTQSVRGDRVTSRLIFRFLDGSYHDETVTYSQRRVFHLLRYHLTQKGPAFKPSTEFSLDGATGESAVHYTNREGKEKIETEQIHIPPDLANGMLNTLVKDIAPNTAETRFSMVVATPKLRVVRVLVSPAGEDWCSVGNSKHKAIRYRIKLEPSGAARVVAPLVGKEPPDIYIWVLTGDSPAFLKSEGPLYSDGPVWRIELASPTWQKR